MLSEELKPNTEYLVGYLSGPTHYAVFRVWYTGDPVIVNEETQLVRLFFRGHWGGSWEWWRLVSVRMEIGEVE